MTEELARLFHMRVGSLGRLPFLGLHGPQRTEHKEGFRRKKTEMGFPKIRGIVLGLSVDGGLGCRGLNELKRASGYIVLRIHVKSPFNTSPVGNTK